MRSVLIILFLLIGSVCYSQPKDNLYQTSDSCYVNSVILSETPSSNTLYHPTKILSLKTNLLSDLILTPNIQVELYTYIWNTSIELEWTFPWWSVKEYHFYYQILNGCVNIKKYFNNNYTGWYVGLYGNRGYYDIFIGKEKGYQGGHYGCGVSVGHVFKVNNCIVEPFLRVGWLGSRYDEYISKDKYYYNWNGDNSKFIPQRFNLNYFGPTAIGVNIGWNIIRKHD